MLADLLFHLSRFLISSCVFSRSGGTETELADLGPSVGLLLAACLSGHRSMINGNAHW